MSPVVQAESAPGLAARLGVVRVGVRQDLEVSRHLFRGKPCYVVCDPVTFQSHRLDPSEYQVFVSIEPAKPLAEIFDNLVGDGTLSPRDEDSFYEFVVALHRLSFLNLPISDEKLLYRRHLARQQARRREKMMGFLFLRIPVVNPDAFLTKTIRYARPLYTRWFFGIWCVLVGAAGWLLAQNWERFAEPLQGVLAARNLPVMWFTLIGLKVLHEFGHAYACKNLGGHVPEMGVFLIVFTPCAYVDATASWGFTRRRDRLIVCLAGMYVESLVAALAVFVWMASGPGLTQAIAYNVVFLAGVITVLFNVNPLMRYDGYYVLSDWVEVPNLRRRSMEYVLALLKRAFLGVPVAHRPEGVRLRALLVTFGVAAATYRAVLVLSIAALVASKMFLVGMMVAVFFVGSTVTGLVKRLVRYLWYAEEVARVRVRAVALSVLAIAGIPAAVFLIPVRPNVLADALLITEREHVVRVQTSGFLQRVAVESGQEVRVGDPLAELTDDNSLEEVAAAESARDATEIRRDVYRVDRPAQALQEEENLKVHRLEVAHSKAQRSDLLVRAGLAGTVIDCLRETDLGRFVQEGEPVATIASGLWRVRALLTEEQFIDAQPHVGGTVEFRSAARPSRTHRGVIRTIGPAGSRIIEMPALTHTGGGNIAVDPETGEAAQPYFDVTIDLLDDDDDSLRHGMTGHVCFRGRAEPLGVGWFRRLVRFTNSLMQS